MSDIRRKNVIVGLDFWLATKTRTACGFVSPIMHVMADPPWRMVFESRERGLRMLSVCLNNGMPFDCSYPTADAMIKDSGLPGKIESAHYELVVSPKIYGQGERIFLRKKNGPTVAWASDLHSFQELNEWLAIWIAAYDIPDAAAQQMKMEFFSSHKLFQRAPAAEEEPVDL